MQKGRGSRSHSQRNARMTRFKCQCVCEPSLEGPLTRPWPSESLWHLCVIVGNL